MTLQVVEARDALDGLARLDDRQASVVITDPPYSDHVHDNGRSGNGSDYGRPRDLAFDSLDPDLRRSTARELGRVTGRWALVFSDLEGAHLWIDALTEFNLEYIRTCIWHKPGAAPQFTGDRPASHAEAIVVAHSTRNGAPVTKRWNGGGTTNVFAHAPVRIQRCHTAQKPVQLIRRLVQLFSDRGELVVDPFAGSGTTGVACKQLARNFIGYEIDEDVASFAQDRIRKTRGDLPFMETIA